MVIYCGTMLAAVFLGWRLQVIKCSQQIGQKNRFRFWLTLFFLLVLLGGVVGFRKFVGTDYGNYTDIYLVMQNKTYAKIAEEQEFLFGFLNRFCFDQFDSYIPVFAISGFVSVGLILYGICKTSSADWLSLFLLFGGMYYFDLFNGMRQMIATAIMFAAYPLVPQKKWFPLILLTLVASGFHASAPVILLVFIFAVYVRPAGVVMFIKAAAFFAAFLFYNEFVEQLINTMNSSGSIYAHYEDMLSVENQGANILRFGLAAVPPVFGFYAWRNLRQQRSDAGILLNISIINALFMLLATCHWIFARFCMFFGIYNILLWPEIIKCFEPKSKRLLTTGVILVYFVYFCLIVHTDSNLLPYQSWAFGGTYA